MSYSYRLLSESIPRSRIAGASVFPADVRKAKMWVEALPRANALVTQRELNWALASLAEQALSGSLRLSLLEELRAVVIESINLLKRQYAGSALPLPAAKASAAQMAESFHFEMALAYRKAAVEICAPSGHVPMLRGGSVAKALARSLWHYTQALAVAWRIYRAPSAGLWTGMHRVYNFAAQMKLEGKSVEDPIATVNHSVLELYMQTLLMSVSHPLGFSQSEQDELWHISRSFAASCVLRRQSPHATALAVPEDADHGPGQGDNDDIHMNWLDMRSFSNEVAAALARQSAGFSELAPPHGVGFRLPIEILQRLKRSFGLAAARIHRRLTGGHRLGTVFGLSGVHFHLAGLRDFDAFMQHISEHITHSSTHASWAMGGTDASRVPMHVAEVLDQSLGGYRLRWTDAQHIRARVGELVGISLAEDGDDLDWMLGVIRWLRYENEDGLSAGVELISRRVLPVGLRVYGYKDVPGPAVRALELSGLESGDGRSFLAASGLDSNALRIDILRIVDESVDDLIAIETLIAGVEVLLNAGDYVQLRPLRDDLVVEQESAENDNEELLSEQPIDAMSDDQYEQDVAFSDDAMTTESDAKHAHSDNALPVDEAWQQVEMTALMDAQSKQVDLQGDLVIETNPVDLPDASLLSRERKRRARKKSNKGIDKV